MVNRQTSFTERSITLRPEDERIVVGPEKAKSALEVCIHLSQIGEAPAVVLKTMKNGSEGVMRVISHLGERDFRHYDEYPFDTGKPIDADLLPRHVRVSFNFANGTWIEVVREEPFPRENLIVIIREFATEHF